MPQRGRRPGSGDTLSSYLSLRLDPSSRAWLDTESERRDIAASEIIREAIDKAKAKAEVSR